MFIIFWKLIRNIFKWCVPLKCVFYQSVPVLISPPPPHTHTHTHTHSSPGYSQFLASLSPHFEQLSLLAPQHDNTLSSTTSDHNTPLNSLTFNEDSSLPPTEAPPEQIDGLLRTPQSSTTTESISWLYNLLCVFWCVDVCIIIYW